MTTEMVGDHAEDTQPSEEDNSELVRDAVVHEALARQLTLEKLGFEEDRISATGRNRWFGQFILPKAKVIFRCRPDLYDVGGDREIVDIITPKGAISFNVPVGDIRSRFNEDDA
jgi:hypothetical protein